MDESFFGHKGLCVEELELVYLVVCENFFWERGNGVYGSEEHG